jgi:hypothetical protein
VELLGYAAYVVVKCVAYVAWCFVGLRLLAPGGPSPLRRAAGLGVARLRLGIVVVAVSCAADISLGIMEGGVVPVGRPFC